MDTKHFVIDTARISERLSSRRGVPLSEYSSSTLGDLGGLFPWWAKLALSFATRGSSIGRLLEIGIPLAAPFLFKRKTPFLEMVVRRIFSAKS